MTNDILLVVDSSKRADAVIAGAVRLAEDRGASLSIQVLGSTPLLIPAFAPLTAMYVAESEMVADEVTRIKDIRAIAETSNAVIRVDGLHDNLVILTRRIGVGSHLCDLIVIGGAADWEVSWLHTHAAAALILGAGTPLLMIPGGTPIASVSHAVLGWKETAEARRAVHDLCAVVEPGGRISVVNVCGNEAATMAMADGVAEVVRHLISKGFAADAHQIEIASQGTSEALEGFAKSRGAQLLAIGAFSHSRLHEIALGSVTRTLLAASNIPVLFCR